MKKLCILIWFALLSHFSLYSMDQHANDNSDESPSTISTLIEALHQLTSPDILNNDKQRISQEALGLIQLVEKEKLMQIIAYYYCPCCIKRWFNPNTEEMCCDTSDSKHKNISKNKKYHFSLWENNYAFIVNFDIDHIQYLRKNSPNFLPEEIFDALEGKLS